MAILPTVMLRDPAGKTRIVNEFDYARDLSVWMARGFRRVGETHGNADDAEVKFQAQQSDIERERRATREAPKDYAARKGEIIPDNMTVPSSRQNQRRSRSGAGSSDA